MEEKTLTNTEPYAWALVNLSEGQAQNIHVAALQDSSKHQLKWNYTKALLFGLTAANIP